jgi:Holliday junction resolvasome RuvABC endonuclease subunit
MLCAGIDLSLSSPAVCINIDPCSFAFNTCKFYCLTSNKKHVLKGEVLECALFPDYATQLQRYHNISNWIVEKINLYKVNVVFLEDYSFNSTGRVFNIAENAGVLKYRLWNEGKQIYTIPPTVIKKTATGKGNSNKEIMQQFFIEETTVNFKEQFKLTEKQWSPSSDLIDSYYVCKTGCFNYYNML